MKDIVPLFQEKLHVFQPFLAREISFYSPLFKHSQAKVADYVQEIEQTIINLSQQTEIEYIEYYAQRLISQVNSLKNAVDKLPKQAAQVQPFRSSYHFPKHIHRLSKEKRLNEYHKALRALNEKLHWLSEQSYLYPEKRDFYVGKIQETEYRKMKCLKAIDELESGKITE